MPSSDPRNERLERSEKDLVVLVDDDGAQRELMSRWLVEAGYRVESFADGESCFRELATRLPSAICLDLHMPGWGGLETMARILERHPRMPVVFLTQDSDVDRVVEAMREGAYDYLIKPVDRPKLETTVRNAVEHGKMSAELSQLRTEVKTRNYAGMVGVSPAMREVFRQIELVAGSEISVLVRGESGTGKELVAKALHTRSERAAGPFVPVNCAAIPETLQESELFGHEKGSFSGADQRRIGRFEEADGGTLFLDEIAEMSASLQAKLLRALQEREFRRVGGSRVLRSDFRVVAASHRNLEEEVEAGRFREDLFYRLAVFELDLPPLRERREDLGLLADAILRDLFPGESYGLSIAALAMLESYRWPGNVRELQNTLQRAAVVCAHGMIEPRDLPRRVCGRARNDAEESIGPPNAAVAAVTTLEEIEREAILDAMRRAEGNRTEVARQLGIGRTTLYRKLRQYGVD